MTCRHHHKPRKPAAPRSWRRPKTDGSPGCPVGANLADTVASVIVTRVNFCAFKPLNLWSFVTAAIGNYRRHPGFNGKGGPRSLVAKPREADCSRQKGQVAIRMAFLRMTRGD